MRYLEVGKQNAERTKDRLVCLGLFNGVGRVRHSTSYVYFPVQDIGEARIKKLFGNCRLTSMPTKETDGRADTFRERMKTVLTEKELRKAVGRYDILGNIAVISVPGGLRKKEKKLASLVMRAHGKITTVVAKGGAVTGKYRTRLFRYVAGKRTFRASYSENGCRFEFDIRKSFFSNRLSFERSRIVKLVRKGENVMVMFAGVGPFAIEIARNQKTSKVVAIELNKSAVADMKKNIKINKTTNVLPVLGDAKRKAAAYAGKMNRIIMPLPKEGKTFLDAAIKATKTNGIVHFYFFGNVDTAFDDAKALVLASAKENGRGAKVMFKRVVRPYSHNEIEVVIDCRITRR